MPLKLSINIKNTSQSMTYAAILSQTSKKQMV